MEPTVVGLARELQPEEEPGNVEDGVQVLQRGVALCQSSERVPNADEDSGTVGRAEAEAQEPVAFWQMANSHFVHVGLQRCRVKISARKVRVAATEDKRRWLEEQAHDIEAAAACNNLEPLWNLVRLVNHKKGKGRPRGAIVQRHASGKILSAL